MIEDTIAVKVLIENPTVDNFQIENTTKCVRTEFGN